MKNRNQIIVDAWGCKHKNSGVLESYQPDGNSARAKKTEKNLGYDCFARRWRKCKDCGEKYWTVEIAEDFFEELHGGKLKKKIIEGIVDYLNKEFDEGNPSS